MTIGQNYLQQQTLTVKYSHKNLSMFKHERVQLVPDSLVCNKAQQRPPFTLAEDFLPLSGDQDCHLFPLSWEKMGSLLIAYHKRLM